MTGVMHTLAELHKTWRTYAQPMPDAPVRPKLWHGVLVSMGEQWLLFPQVDLDAVIPCPPVSPIPGTRSFVLGIASWQGVLLPVLSGVQLCGYPARGATGKGHALVVRRRGFHFALAISELRGQIVLPAGDCRATTFADPDSPCAAWCRGSHDLPDRLVPVVDIDRLLDDPRLTATAQIQPMTEDRSS